MSTTCEFCPDPPETQRLRTLPPYGLDPESGKPRTSTEFCPDDHDRSALIVVCSAHEHARWTASGEVWTPPVRQGPGLRGRAKQEGGRRTARVRLIAALGGECEVCHTAEDPPIMRIITPGRIGLDLTAAEWHDIILDTPNILKLCRLFCYRHQPIQAENGRSADLRSQAMAAYGGQCAHCPETEGLWLVRQEGTPPLLRPNGGRYSSTAKYARLSKDNWPEGWELLCPTHATVVGISSRRD